MNKLANMRQWSERMNPGNFGMGRPNVPMNQMNPNARRDVMPQPAASMAMPQPIDNPNAIVHHAFNIPFASDLVGPNTEDILHSTADAVLKWTHPADAPDDVQVHDLPIHAANLAKLRKTCSDITGGPFNIEAHVMSTTPKNAKGNQVTTVCLAGSQEMVYKTREMILNDNQTFLQCATVDVEGHLVCDFSAAALKSVVTDTLDGISSYCGVDIFLLGPKLTPLVDGVAGDAEMRVDQRWRVAIYGDLLSVDHAKTRVLIHIDTLLGRTVDALKLDASLHPVVCGRQRKNIKLIESQTGTAIYFPSPFSQMYRFCPPEAKRRDPNDIFITGESAETIALAKQRIHEVVTRTRIYMKDVNIPAPKIDSILLHRLDKVRKIIDANGCFILFPVLAAGKSLVRVQGQEGLHVERTLREIATLASQFYSSSWFLLSPEGPQMPPQSRQLPSPADIRTLLGDVCANSDAEVSFDNNFQITGSDDAVKTSLMIMSDVRFLVQGNHQLRVKIELANEHREFVSGKKNGKINKIMSQSNVTIIFDGFSDYNFIIEVGASSYEAMKQGLSLVEQEMPASISFHVPDQYHKRIIGIGGQHIQSIMKKHSVFVKFSNAMDRGGIGREDDDIKVDNVICRTPARNAQNLDAVKNEILEMVDRADSEYTSQIVKVDRLYHRQLLARLAEIDELESKFNCKIVFPSTEQASDEVTVNGPQWQVPHCVDEFLGMVPDHHELVLAQTPELMNFLKSTGFSSDLVSKLKTQYEAEVSVKNLEGEVDEQGKPSVTLLWTFTRNNAGGLGDAIDFLLSEFTTAGVEATIVKGSIPKAKTDSFEDSLQYFDSKLLQNAPPSVTTDSPVKAAFEGEVARERSTIFDKLRKPGSMTSIASFLDRRKNSSHSVNGNFFKGSSNVSKSSLISIESTRSFNADRNPWNDSGVNLNEEDHPWAPRLLSNGEKLTPTHLANPGDMTPRHGTRASGDSGRPSTSHSTNSGYPGPIGPFR